MTFIRYVILAFTFLIILISAYVLLYVDPREIVNLSPVEILKPTSIALATKLVEVEENTVLPASIATSPADSCELSLTESDGWFCESNTDWNRRKEIHQMQDKRNRNSEAVYHFFYKNWEPTIHCTFEQRIGNVGDGGKWVCDLHKLQTNNTVPLIYSFGSNGDFSFEQSVKQLLPNAEIHTFDSNVYQCPLGVCTFHQVIVGDESSIATKSLHTVINELGHRQRKIDILKIDVEGSEFVTFKTFFQYPRNSTNELPYIRQILLEIHLPNGDGNEPARTTNELFEMFRSNNYAIFHKETNLYSPQTCYEYAFLRLNPTFFNAS